MPMTPGFRFFASAFLLTLGWLFLCRPAGSDIVFQDIHAPLYEAEEFPSAQSCQACHPMHYEEWSASPHAYAQISPVFNAMHAKINQLTNGTNGDFCIRCHTPVGMTQNEPLFISNAERSEVSVEGVTCISCHRRSKPYGLTSGRFSPKSGSLFQPVYGPTGNEELKRVLNSKEFSVVTGPEDAGRAIHSDVVPFYQMVTSRFCGTCHDVNHMTGFRLEEAFSQYHFSPAADQGLSCQDCHMGKTPGVPSGYHEEPAAIVGGKPTRVRRRTNHMFVGPDYSIVHPGIFPHNPAAKKIATLNQWLAFNYIEGWGTDDFEDSRTGEESFPEPWNDEALRFEAREILEDNMALLERAAHNRKALLQAGYQFGEIIVGVPDDNGLTFRVEVRNATTGHPVPTGFDAERLVYLRVDVVDANGKTVFQSGDLDPNGDLRDKHSLFVQNGELPLDKYLLNLQSTFLVRMVRGGEREQVLAVNSSVSPLPFIRPPVQSRILIGRPANERKHRKQINPGESVWARYAVGKDQLAGTAGPYTASVKLIAGMVPVNLVHAIHDVGFDYGMSAKDVAEAVVAGHQVLWEKEFALTPGPVR